MMADAAFLPAMQQVKAPGVLHTLVTEEFASWYGGFDGADPRTRAAIDDTALQLYSSGTTGGWQRSPRKPPRQVSSARSKRNCSRMRSPHGWRPSRPTCSRRSIQWNPIYGLLQVSASVGPQEFRGPVPPEIAAAVGTLVASGQDEPLTRQLLREAWTQKVQSHRSAVVLAIAAVGVSLKECISALVPDVRWLVENVPMPPSHNMLTEYLPLLPVRARLAGKTLVPPDLLHEIRTGVELRNRVVHLGHVKMTAEKLDRILLRVSDLLWIWTATRATNGRYITSIRPC